jgi:hypothetical protein
MSITYDDIVDAHHEARKNGHTVDHIVLTENAMESVTDDETMMTVESLDGGAETGLLTSGFSVYEGDANVVVTDSGREFTLKY